MLNIENQWCHTPISSFIKMPAKGFLSRVHYINYNHKHCINKSHNGRNYNLKSIVSISIKVSWSHQDKTHLLFCLSNNKKEGI